MDNLTPGQRRTAAATAARKRARQERMAIELRGAGWLVVEPERDTGCSCEWCTLGRAR